MFAEIMREDIYCAYRIRLELLLGISRDKSDQEIHALIEAGFMPERITSLIGLYLQIVSEPDQTSALKKMLRDRPSFIRPMSAYESDKLYRLGHIAALAQVVFGDDTKAMRWLSKPKERLAGWKPYELLSTTPGTNEVERMLIQVSEPFAF
jgi:putative toxin-antitoxin system antitoxin component (TIGR02293 family)